jgi:hypothetical protein
MLDLTDVAEQLMLLQLIEDVTDVAEQLMLLQLIEDVTDVDEQLMPPPPPHQLQPQGPQQFLRVPTQPEVIFA